MDDVDPGLVLRQCLKEGTRPLWEKFIRLVQPVVAAGVVRALTSVSSYRRDLADDLVQATFVRLCQNDYRALRSFRSDHPNALRKYLKTIATHIVFDYLDSPHNRDHENIDEVAGYASPAEQPHRDAERRILLNQVEKCLQGEPERSRRVFWLYHRQGMKPKEIAAMPAIGLGMSGVETLVFKLTNRVRDCLRKSGWFTSVATGQG
jgi:RNA polymerase sigma-70 factor (ECF subfamily)